MQNPICVDLDGTLVRANMLFETLCGVSDWRALLSVPLWLGRGRAYLKQELARRAHFDASALPYNEKLLEYLREQRARGRRIVLATAADRSIAESINTHLQLFDDVIASNGVQNLRGAHKAETLCARFGKGGFTYAGNDRTDLEVWREAGTGILVNTSRSVTEQVGGIVKIEACIFDRPVRASAFLEALRPHQWVKNLLVFVPLVTAYAMTDYVALLNAAIAFLAFCSTASGIYIINDLTDLAADRRHPRKRNRPFASGALPIGFGMATASILLLIGVILSALSNTLAVVLLYMVVAIAYSLKIKEMLLVDIFTLAAFYTMRLVAGGEATGHQVSLWLLTFSSFLFLALALVKRVAELIHAKQYGVETLSRRAYWIEDLPLLQTMGIAASFVSAMVLALYVQSDWVATRHLDIRFLSLMVPLVLFWQCRIWLATVRGHMHDDPIVYTLKDWVSRLVMSAAVVVFLLAAL